MQKVPRHLAYWNFAKTLVLAPGFDRSSRSTKLHLFGRLPLAARFLPFAGRAGILREGGARIVEIYEPDPLRSKTKNTHSICLKTLGCFFDFSESETCFPAPLFCLWARACRSASVPYFLCSNVRTGCVLALLGPRLETICLDELLQLGQLEPKSAAHLHKRNPALVH
jgi:hypothetical protein